MKQPTANKLLKGAAIGQSGRLEIVNNATSTLADKLGLVPDELSRPLTDKMTEVYENSRRIGIQAKELSTKTAQLKALTGQWKTLSSGVENKVKEFGDVQNWAEMIDQDLRVLEETIKQAKRLR
ncbi:hypothetical protein AWJ20_808 [Sugiyamaella lignohabitans]|uniref:Biogenesis of lysosome-related organelles complex 1 subunit 1 n=1 Tax=Sugiyamaella lignohabitans TaxID=796027 RepID=A0A167D6T2_9ASCO|nr:uncharacterized protein AWJ20_808 [Sugiyamaella lignohabitans]ANB12551.1 hypothetical protein AWJ20_808 [Sugiyamaella lignohabitans]